MEWEDLLPTVDDWVARTSQPGFLVRQAAANVLTASEVGYYLDPALRIGIFAPEASAADSQSVKAAAVRALPAAEVRFLSYQDLADPNSTWVKVAYSPTLRRAGELMNFFPGQYPGGIPNAPSPLAAMLTSGLVGAGLGWAGGRVAKKFLPKGYGDNLGRTGAAIGGMLGAVPGAIWAGANHGVGLPLNSPHLLEAPAGSEPEFHFPSEALDKAASTFGAPDFRRRTSADVNIDHLGRTLWDYGASPGLAATTMGTMYAAQQMPDPRSRPGWVTAGQLGSLAEGAIGNYGRGALVGEAINLVIGTPIRPATVGLGAAALGVLGAIVPRLLGG